jgi:hypothetical protein
VTVPAIYDENLDKITSRRQVGRPAGQEKNTPEKAWKRKLHE